MYQVVKKERAQRAMREVEKWNAKYPVGSVVRKRVGSAIITAKTRSPAWEKGGSARIELAGQKRDVPLWSLIEARSL